MYEAKTAMKLLINATNLHVGGGLQVATSFLYELQKLDVEGLELSIAVSSTVDSNLVDCRDILLRRFSYKVVDMSPWRSLTKLNELLQVDSFDVVFTIFGPHYCIRKPKRLIVGFAHPLILFRSGPMWKHLSGFNFIIQKFKYFIQELFFLRSDVLIVEQKFLIEKLKKQFQFKKKQLRVVSNCLSSVYSNPDLWKSVKVPKGHGDYKIGFVGRNYPHKNTSIFPKVKSFLLEKYGILVDFYVTFNEAEWIDCPENFTNSVINVGPLLVEQCPSFYQQMDAVLFPSRAECFSATPLEAMAMEKPVFLFDFVFNRETCGDHAIYLDDDDPETIAHCISEYIKSPKPKADIALAKSHAIDSFSARERAGKYLEIAKEPY